MGNSFIEAFQEGLKAKEDFLEKHRLSNEAELKRHQAASAARREWIDGVVMPVVGEAAAQMLAIGEIRLDEQISASSIRCRINFQLQDKVPYEIVYFIKEDNSVTCYLNRGEGEDMGSLTEVKATRCVKQFAQHSDRLASRNIHAGRDAGKACNKAGAALRSRDLRGIQPQENQLMERTQLFDLMAILWHEGCLRRDHDDTPDQTGAVSRVTFTACRARRRSGRPIARPARKGPPRPCGGHGCARHRGCAASASTARPGKRRSGRTAARPSRGLADGACGAGPRAECQV